MHTATMAWADSDELREAGDLAGRGGAAVAALVRDTHLAIARRAYRLGGPAARPVRLAGEAATLGVYAAVGGGLRLAGLAGGRIAAGRAERALTDHPRGELAVGALNGAWGDWLARRRSPLALELSLRHDRRDLPVERAALAEAHPAATGDVVVFVHGLCETDRAWLRSAGEHHGDPTSSHGARLHRDLGLIPLYLRYNTGLRISDNGARLGSLLTRLVAQWPVPLTRLTLIGHSMGGLVIRAACHTGVERAEPWVPLVRRVVYLGSPHLGAPLEQAATVTGLALRRLPETRPLATALASRSVGIKDLRHGDVRETDWAGLVDLDAWRPAPAECAPLLPSAEHFYLGATIARRHDTVAARVIGDALVPYPSAAGIGRNRRLALDVGHGRHLGGLHHLDLLNHPRVYAVLRDWLAG